MSHLSSCFRNQIYFLDLSVEEFSLLLAEDQILLLSLGIFFFFKALLNSLINSECGEQEVSPLGEAVGGVIESKRKLLPGGVSIPTLLFPTLFQGIFLWLGGQVLRVCVKLGSSGVLASGTLRCPWDRVEQVSAWCRGGF